MKAQPHPAPALLLMSCSQRKAPGVARGRAWDVYDGQLFRVLKKLFCEHPDWRWHLHILIVSAKYGVIPGAARIAMYDARLPRSTCAPVGKWAAQLLRLTRGRNYQQVHVNLGAAYRAALPDLTEFFDGAEVSFASGGIGQRNAATRAWALGVLGG